MAESTLNQVQRLVEQLSPHEQAHLLAFLALRMAQVVTAPPPCLHHLARACCGMEGVLPSWRCPRRQ